MKVTAERVPDSQVVLEIEVEPERVERSLDQAYRRLANRARIPGFRPGKAPRQIIERTIGHEALLQEALDKLVPEVYREAVDESDIDPIHTPDVEIKTLDPVVIRATVAVRPTVTLGDYKSIQVERVPVEVSESDVDAEIEVWRRRNGAWEPVERGVELGDLLRADVEMSVDGKPVVKQEDAEFLFREELESALPGMVEGLKGAPKGAVRAFDVTLPDDFRDPALRGVQGSYSIDVKEIKEQKLPEVDDEFAKSVGDGFETVAALREWVADGLKRQAEEAESRRIEQEALEDLVEQTTFEYPQVLIEHEVTHLLQEQAGSNGDAKAMERYLSQIGLSEDEVRTQLEPVAIDRVKRSLAMNEFAKAEGVEVGDEDIDAEIDRIARSSEQLRNALNTPEFRSQIARSQVTQKTLGRLAELTAVDEAAKPAKASRSKKSAAAPAVTEAEAATATEASTTSGAEAGVPKKPARSRKKITTGDAS